MRRLKTDKSVIADLPDKTEVKAFCLLSRKQAALYQQAVDDLAQRLEDVEGIQRKGTGPGPLDALQTNLQPSRRNGSATANAAEADSGKFARLRDIAEVMAARQEKALVFTQFREVDSAAGRVPGLGIRADRVWCFTARRRSANARNWFAVSNRTTSTPFFILSLKAGGAGLNLTAASHVIHFDRWWNPAVENQATDRAFRIGQTRNVLVHKFVCRGTVEDKIDEMIASKQQMAGDFLGGGADAILTEMNDAELLRIIALDLNAAIKEA